MKNIKNYSANQFLHELQTWGRALDFYKQENAFLKTHLAQLLDDNTDKDFVEVAECFNNRFVFTDDYIMTLQQDIRLQKEMLQNFIINGGEENSLVHPLQQKLRDQMEIFEKDILQQKKEFNLKLVNYLRAS